MQPLSTFQASTLLQQMLNCPQVGPASATGNSTGLNGLLPWIAGLLFHKILTSSVTWEGMPRFLLGTRKRVTPFSSPGLPHSGFGRTPGTRTNS